MSCRPMWTERTLLATAGLLLAGWSPVAQAIELPDVLSSIPTRIDEEGIRMGVRVVAELWEEPELQKRFEQNRGLTAGLSLGVPLHEFLVVELEVAMNHRVESVDEEGNASGDTFDMVPIAFQIQGRLPLGGAGELYLGVGPNLVPYRWGHPGTKNTLNSDYVTDGTKLQAEVRLGFRFDSGLIQPAMAPGIGRQIKAVDFEAYAARRHQRQPISEKDGVATPERDGVDLAAYRLGLGLSFRF